MKILDPIFNVYDRFHNLVSRPLKHTPINEKHWGARLVSALILILIVLQLVLGFLWNREPASFNVVENAARISREHHEDMVTGYITTATLIRVAETLLDKPGGFLANDRLPPAVFMDNIPNWELGVMEQIRDMNLALRNDFSRSQSQSVDDKDVIAAENHFRINTNSWIFPAAESEYQDGIDSLYRYLHRLTDENQEDAQFYTRADNLNNWLGLVEKRLGSLSQRLSSSVGQERINTDLAGDASAKQSTPGARVMMTKTPWRKIDDVFYRARGSAWALNEFLKAIEVDFQDVLRKKNALISLKQIIRELDATQETVWSPMILNGGGFGLFANHSLVMANYISRANAAVIDLRDLLKQG